jgi:phospholipid/cholesterol/gamma-HCH transport system permease protein
MYFILTSIIGGFIFSKIFLNMSLSFYLDAVVQVLSVEDFYLLAFKNIVGGAVIFTISCYQGLKMKSGPHEVPQSTTKAVVDSIIYVIAFNLIVTILFYINQLIKFGII